MKVKLIDPSLGVHNPDAGQEHAKIVPTLSLYGVDPYVPSGAVIDVPDEVGGSEPRWRAPQPGDDVSFMSTKTEFGNLHVLDLGSGLLAQVGIWERVTSDGEPE